jgi:formate hydrogenlyase subunit 4
MIELGTALKLLLYMSVIACIFFPFGLADSDAGLRGFLIGGATYLVKLAVGGVLLGTFEMSIAKMRVFRLPNLVGAALMLGLLGVLLLFVSRGM